jgi:hypothetical protein
MAASGRQGRCLGVYEHQFLTVTHQLVDADEDYYSLPSCGLLCPCFLE